MMVLFLFLSIFTLADSLMQSEASVNGIYLGQLRDMFKVSYGEPLKQIRTEDGWIYEFYDLKGDTSAYVLAKFPSDDTVRVYSIQVSGYGYDEFIPFKGFRLGDSKMKVMRNQPPVARIDTIPDPTTIVYFFDGVNYSLEFDRDDRLYGIGLFGYNGFGKAKPIPDFEQFRIALMDYDKNLLRDLLMPDCEIYLSDTAICFIHEPLGRMLDNAENPFTKVLFSTVREALLVVRQSELNIRLYPEVGKMFRVLKFNTGAIEEIVFADHCGQNKVYEIRLR